MTPSSSLAQLSGEDSFSRVAGIAPAPLLPGEQEAEYATLIARIVAVAQPRDAIEDLLTRDVVDLTWEIFRLRRVKAGILKASVNTGVEGVLNGLGQGPVLSFDYNEKLAKKWAAGYKDARKEVKAALDKRLIPLSQARLYVVDALVWWVDLGRRRVLAAHRPVAFRWPSYGDEASA